jgi:predicted lipoprotein with Yx(FWY)xxD motif
LAAVGALLVAGVVLARTFTLTVARSAPVTNTSGQTVRENIIVSSRGRAVYMLSGDSKSHPKCTRTNGCLTFWPPVTVKSAKSIRRGAGVKGRLGTWHRDGFLQLTLNAHPLYNFSGDSQKDKAMGEGIKSFGGTWHVGRASGTSAPTGSTPPTTPPTTTTPSGSTTPTTPTYPIY